MTSSTLHRSTPSFFTVLFVLVSMLGLSLRPTEAATLVYESFDYAAGSPIAGLDGGEGFVETWADDSVEGNTDSINSGGLTYSGLSTSGNALRMVSPTSAIGSDVMRRFSTITGTAGGTTWVSFLFALDGASAPLVSGDFAALTLSPNTNAGGGVYFGIFNDPHGAEGDKVFGIGTGLSSPAALTDIAFVPGQTYLLVASIEWQEGPNPEVLNLYVNPGMGGVPATPDATAAPLNIATNAGTNRLLKTAIFAGGVGTEWIFDEIRVGESFGDVVVSAPEPGTLTLALVSAVFLLRRKARAKGLGVDFSAR
jgi:hypothetical protein